MMVLVLLISTPVFAAEYTVTLTPEQEAAALWSVKNGPRWQDRQEVTPTVQNFLNQVVKYGADVAESQYKQEEIRQRQERFQKLTPAEQLRVEQLLGRRP